MLLLVIHSIVTGKSSLAAELAAQAGCELVARLGKEVIEQHVVPKARAALQRNADVVIDSVNWSKEQRAYWVGLGDECGAEVRSGQSGGGRRGGGRARVAALLAAAPEQSHTLLLVTPSRPGTPPPVPQVHFIWVNTPVETCIERAVERGKQHARQPPQDDSQLPPCLSAKEAPTVIWYYKSHWEDPHLDEGLHSIKVGAISWAGAGLAGGRRACMADGRRAADSCNCTAL